MIHSIINYQESVMKSLYDFDFYYWILFIMSLNIQFKLLGNSCREDFCIDIRITIIKLC